jgi:hypothetical protein
VDGRPAAVFYPLGHPTPYTYVTVPMLLGQQERVEICRRAFNQQLSDAMSQLNLDQHVPDELEFQHLEAENTGLRHQLDDLTMEMDSKDRILRELSKSSMTSAIKDTVCDLKSTEVGNLNRQL